MRLDKYLKVSRIIKRRTVAKEAGEGGRITLNGRVAKPSADVKPGDILEIRFGEHLSKYRVLAVAETVRSLALMVSREVRVSSSSSSPMTLRKVVCVSFSMALGKLSIS